MMRYILFAGETYYPGGGWNDFVADGDTVEELELITKKMEGADNSSHDWDWWHIVDTQQDEVVAGKFNDDQTPDTFKPLGRWWAIHNGIIIEE